MCHWHSSHCGIHKSLILLALTQWLISIPQGGGGGGGGYKNFSALHTRGTEWPSVRVVPLWFVLTLLQVFFLHLFLSRLSLVVERENDDRIVTLNNITHSLKSNSARKVRLRIDYCDTCKILFFLPSGRDLCWQQSACSHLNRDLLRRKSIHKVWVQVARGRWSWDCGIMKIANRWVVGMGICCHYRNKMPCKIVLFVWIMGDQSPQF